MNFPNRERSSGSHEKGRRTLEQFNFKYSRNRLSCPADP
jgi:hypothetical protein